MPKRTKKKKPGVRLTPVDKAKRLEVLKQHGKKTSPDPWSNQKCADALGMKIGTWQVWKSNQKKPGAKKRGPGRPRKVKAGSVDGLAGLISSVQDIQRDRDRLQKALEKVQGILAGV